jgi:hypothetical protein
VLHAHVFVPGPVLPQPACTSQPPLTFKQESIGAHTTPFPEYPALQAHVAVVGLVDTHIAVVAQPPLFTAHAPTPLHVCPLPV